MAYKKVLKNSKSKYRVTDKELVEIGTNQQKFSELFGHSENLVISFFPNGSDSIWLKDKTDHKMGIEIKFALGDLGLVVQVRNLASSKEIHCEQLTREILEVIQLKN